MPQTHSRRRTFAERDGDKIHHLAHGDSINRAMRSAVLRILQKRAGCAGPAMAILDYCTRKRTALHTAYLRQRYGRAVAEWERPL